MTSSNVRKLVAKAGLTAALPSPVHPQMLRHACGYELPNDGHDTQALQHYLGHKNIAYSAIHRDGARSIHEFLVELESRCPQVQTGGVSWISYTAEFVDVEFR